MSRVISSLVNLIFAMGAMVFVFIVTGIKWTYSFLFVPVVLLQLYVFCLGLELFLAQATVFFRDVKHLYTTFLVAWMYVTPIFYPEHILSAGMSAMVKSFNPLYFYISQFRVVILDNTLPPAELVAKGFLAMFLMLFIGMWSFAKTQDRFILYI